MRRLDYILIAAAEKVGLSHGNGGYDFEALAEEIVLAAQAGGRLPASDYRLIWGIWSIFWRHRARPDA